MTFYDVDTLLGSCAVKQFLTTHLVGIEAFGTVGGHLNYLTFTDIKLHLPCPRPCSHSIQIILEDLMVSR